MSYVFISFAGLFVVTECGIGDGEGVCHLAVRRDGCAVVGRRGADFVADGAQAYPCHAPAQYLCGHVQADALVAG